MLVSFPCTGGCLFNVGINSKRPEECSDKLLKHWTLFRKLWRNYERLNREASRQIPTMFEWPRSCTYWAKHKVQKLLESIGMKASDFDGCQYGLKSVRKGREHLFLRKPWTIVSNIPEIFPLVCRLCPGEAGAHRHDTCNNENAIASQYYTPFMVTIIHMAIMRHSENRMN